MVLLLKIVGRIEDCDMDCILWIILIYKRFNCLRVVLFYKKNKVFL